MIYYSQQIEEVFQQEQTTKEGLSQAEAKRRLLENGENRLEEAKRKPMTVRFIEQMRDPMILVLIAAAILSGVFGEIADMIIIFVVVLLNSVLGVVQESKAEKAIEALQKMSAPHTKVRRDGVLCDIQAKDLVVGDIVLLEAGDSVPADLRLIETVSMKVEEAALTGESTSVEKDSKALLDEEQEIPLGDRVNMAYMGTNVVYGRGEGIVAAVGMDTEMGKIAAILSGTEGEKTPLQIKLLSLSKILSAVVLGICIFIFFFNVIRAGGLAHSNVFELLLTSISLAVAAIPEGLVVVVTVLLSIGVTKMSKRNAIIRKLTAVETLGCTQVICSDKTGTLTQNKMTVTDHFGDETLLAEAMALCNDTGINDAGEFIGEPTELALVEYAALKGLSKDELEQRSKRVGEAPFDSVRKMMSTVHEVGNGFYRQYTKGAPDEVLSRCDTIFADHEILPLTKERRQMVLAANKNMADRALRVLGAAWRNYDTKPESFAPEEMEQGMTFIGLTGMVDPVRPEVKQAMMECQSAGIRPIMITGDHKDTAVAIAKELEILEHDNQAMTGSELSLLSDEEFEKRFKDISVYARVQPEHKVRIVNAWRGKGKVTAMTGDGVNDAPALKNADIGIGMGITGTDVTKNVADLVLADDNFATIVYAVEDGRRIYENIRKAIQFLLASNLSEVAAIFFATVIGVKLFAPIHILWINLVTDTFPAMALGMEEAESDSMKRLPRDSKEGIFSDGLGIQVVYQGILIAVLTLLSFYIGWQTDSMTGMTMAFLTLSMCEIFHSLNLRSRTKSIFRMQGQNKYLIVAMLFSFFLTMVVIYVPGLSVLFQLTPLGIRHFAAGIGLAFLVIPIVELIKRVRWK